MGFSAAIGAASKLVPRINGPRGQGYSSSPLRNSYVIHEVLQKIGHTMDCENHSIQFDACLEAWGRSN